MAPVVLAAELLEVLLEQGTHLDDAVSHSLELDEPLGVELGVVHDGGGDAGAVDGGVGVQRPNEDLDLRVDALLLFGRRTSNRECTYTFAIQSLPRN